MEHTDSFTLKVDMPLYVEESRGKKHHINLNKFRNWHWTVKARVKKKYQSMVGPFPFKTNKKVRLTLTHFKATARKCDRANILCMHEKFFCDALVEQGVIPDDNDDFIESTLYRSGGIDRKNPRVEILVETV